MALRAASDLANFSAFHLKKVSTVGARAVTGSSATIRHGPSAPAFINGVRRADRPDRGLHWPRAAPARLRYDLPPRRRPGKFRRGRAIDIGASLDQRRDEYRHVPMKRQHQRAVTFVVLILASAPACIRSWPQEPPRRIIVHDLNPGRPIVIGRELTSALAATRRVTLT